MSRDSSQSHFYKISKHLIDNPSCLHTGVQLGGCQGGTAPPKFCLAPQNFSGLFLKVLHRPLTAPLVAKLAPPVAPPNENVWLRPCLHTKQRAFFVSVMINIGADFLFSLCLLVMLCCIRFHGSGAEA